MTSKVSFTIRPPTTSSRPAARYASSSRVSETRSNSFIPHDIDSSDEEEEEGAIEAVTAFGQSGAQRLHEKPKPSGPLVIPALADRDWRAVARLRKQKTFIPDGLAATVGKDGSQGGLGTRDYLNSGPQAIGLVKREKNDPSEHLEDGSVKIEAQEVFSETTEKVEDNEDERARRALLASLAGGTDDQGLTIDAIPVSGSDYSHPMDETDAFKQDVVTRPDSASLADYERVPVSQFGAALLRGMGWKEGTAASRTRPGPVEPWLPSSRPALLGLGAKERPQEDIPFSGNGKGGFVNKRPEKRYVPVIKSQREGSELPTSSRSRSRSPVPSRNVSRVPSSKSASPYPRNDDMNRHPRQPDHHRVKDEHNYDRSGRSSDRQRKDSDRDSDREYHKEHRHQERSREPRRDRVDRSRKEKDNRRDERERYSRDKGDRY